ncbi:MAG: hypothetical protein FWF49_00535, partial [Oscillospiraceae bacterium]|nr:hypothetical protein [Oscillospiraceae bacterium]
PSRFCPMENCRRGISTARFDNAARRKIRQKMGLERLCEQTLVVSYTQSPYAEVAYGLFICIVAKDIMATW